MSITEDLANILSARYGKDVRQSIHDGIQHCYEKTAPTQEEVAPVVEAYLEEHPITADAELSTTSINPIQNKAVAESISQLNSNLGSYAIKFLDYSNASKIVTTSTQSGSYTVPSDGMVFAVIDNTNSHMNMYVNNVSISVWYSNSSSQVTTPLSFPVRKNDVVKWVGMSNGATLGADSKFVPCVTI